METLDEQVRKARMLEEDWDGEQAEIPFESAIVMAEDFARALIKLGVKEQGIYLDAVPDGTVDVWLPFDGGSILVNFEDKDKVDLCVSFGGGGRE